MSGKILNTLVTLAAAFSLASCSNEKKTAAAVIDSLEPGVRTSLVEKYGYSDALSNLEAITSNVSRNDNGTVSLEILIGTYGKSGNRAEIKPLIQSENDKYAGFVRDLTGTKPDVSARAKLCGPSNVLYVYSVLTLPREVYDKIDNSQAKIAASPLR